MVREHTNRHVAHGCDMVMTRFLGREMIKQLQLLAGKVIREVR